MADLAVILWQMVQIVAVAKTDSRTHLACQTAGTVPMVRPHHDFVDSNVLQRLHIAVTLAADQHSKNLVNLDAPAPSFLIHPIWTMF